MNLENAVETTDHKDDTDDQSNPIFRAFAQKVDEIGMIICGHIPVSVQSVKSVVGLVS